MGWSELQSIDFGSCRWGESHSPCFIFSLNCPETPSLVALAVFPILRPMLLTLFS